MNKIQEIIRQPEGRRLEFKEQLPSHADLAKTIVAFANDAGGDFYLGIKNDPREITGVPETDLMTLEEKITNIIHDQCYPVILPEITFLNIDGKHILRVQIYKGSNLPYFLKKKSYEQGTYIRVGSTNRLASTEIIAELKRQQMGRSFDSELVYEKPASEISFEFFNKYFLEKAGESVSNTVLRKLDLVKTEHGTTFPTNALILISDDELKRRLFPLAKIECARFKGEVPGNFIDQKTFEGSILEQSDLAYQFVLRHISQGSTDYTGVYRNDRWEYPVIAIREAIRNAIIHRDYSLTEMDIKIAVFDYKIEITNPGKLAPTVDFSDMLSGQSSIRNKILAPVFKHLGIIEQWGNGLKLIAEELKNYPEVEFRWKEPGAGFRIIFEKIKANGSENMNAETSDSTKEISAEVSKKVSVKTSVKTSVKILQHIENDYFITIPALAELIGVSERSIERSIQKLQRAKKLLREGPDKGGHWKILK